MWAGLQYGEWAVDAERCLYQGTAHTPLISGAVALAGRFGVSTFTFLQGEWPALFEAASKAAEAVHSDPRTACFYARRALELAVAWVYKHDPALKLPYQDNLSALIHEPSFKQAAGETVFSKARTRRDLQFRAG